MYGIFGMVIGGQDPFGAGLLLRNPARIFCIIRLSFPDTPNSIVIFGLGYGVDSLKDIEWLKTKEIYYWGDIDTHGFAILSQIRGYFPQVESILMDREVINRYRYLAVAEPKSKRFLGELDNLTVEEESVFEELKRDEDLQGLRIEQERVPISYLKLKLVIY